MKMKCVAIAGWLLAATMGLQAQVFDVSPFFGYRFGGSIETIAEDDADIEAGPTYGVSLNYAPYASDSLKLEIFWSRQESGLDLHGAGGLNHLDMYVDEFLIGGVYELGEGRLKEAVTVLVGATMFSPEDLERQVNFTASLGVGVKYYLNKHFALRADLRGFCTVVEAEGAFISNGGTTVAFFSGDALWQGEVSAGFTLSF